MLQAHEVRHADDLAFKLGVARILAWSGRHADCEAKLSALSAAERANPDAMLLAADLDFYRGRFEQAITGYQAVLARVQDYGEARDGLARAQAAQAASVKPVAGTALPEAPAAPRWALTVGGEYSQFDQEGRLSWRQQFVQIDHLRQGLSPYARWARYDQYALLDMETDFGFNWAATARMNLNAGVSLVSRALFKPERRLYANVDQLLFGQVAAPSAIWGTLQWRDEAYADGARVVTLNPGLACAPIAGIKLSGHLIAVDKSDAARVHGRQWRVDLTPSDRWSWHVGYADAPESELSKVVRTKTWFAGVTFDVGSNYTARLGYARDDRVNTYKRQVINASVTRRF